MALLSQIEKENAAKIIVTTRAALDQPAPSRGTLRSASLEIQRGPNMAMPALLNALSGAGYERVAQVTTRGQFAVRGGIVDIFSWQTALPLRIESTATKLNRCVNSTSILKLPSALANRRACF